MQRVKIELPLKTLFSYHFIIEENDINEANHMGNERILVFANKIRTDFLDRKGFEDKDYKSQFGVIIANHSIHYKNEGVLGDEITCHVGVLNVTECTFDLIFHFIKSNDQTLALVRTGCVCYNYEHKRIQALPARFVNVFTK